MSAARASSTAVSAGYVPDGLTAQQWEDMKKKKETEAAKRKKEVASKKFEVGSCRVALSRCSRVCVNISLGTKTLVYSSSRWLHEGFCVSSMLSLSPPPPPQLPRHSRLR